MERCTLSQGEPGGKTPVCQCEDCRWTSLWEAWTPSRGEIQNSRNELKKKWASIKHQFLFSDAAGFVPLPASLLMLPHFVSSAAERRRLSLAASVPSEHLSARGGLREITVTRCCRYCCHVTIMKLHLVNNVKIPWRIIQNPLSITCVLWQWRIPDVWGAPHVWGHFTMISQTWRASNRALYHVLSPI